MSKDILKSIHEFNNNARYNKLLKFEDLPRDHINELLLTIFDRDIKNNTGFTFRDKPIKPLALCGNNNMDFGELYKHLTTIEDTKEVNGRNGKSERKSERKFDENRSKRLHWIKFHTDEELKNDDILIFSYFEPKGIRTYIFDKMEKYAVVLEPKKNYYFLITAYYCIYDHTLRILEGKYNKRLADVH